MAKVSVRVIGKPYRGREIGETFEVPAREAKVMRALKRVEHVEAAPAAEPQGLTPIVQPEPARAASRPVTGKAAEPEAKPVTTEGAKRAYRRRDMQAE